MTSYITMKKELVLGAAANISHMVKVGDHVKTGDALIVFEEVPNDPDMAMFLDKLGTDLGEEIQKDSKNYLKSKYTGTIEDIKIYYTVPEEELSPSYLLSIEDSFSMDFMLKPICFAISFVVL